ATIVPYWPSNQPALRSGLAVWSMSSPTLPVTQTAAFVTQAVTPRMTKSPASCATRVTAAETASQTLPTIGSWQGLGIGRIPASVRLGDSWSRGKIAASSRRDIDRELAL